MCGIGRAGISTIALSRITAASRVDVGRCSASKAPNAQSATANATANSKIFFAADLECATTFPRLHDVITTCAEQPQPSAFWKRYERDAPPPTAADYPRRRET